MFVTATVFVCSALFSNAVSEGEDAWSGWRGPGGNGIAEGSPPIEWGEELNVRWKTAIPGKGSSSPIVWGDKVFVTTAVPTVEEEEPEERPRGGRGFGGFGRSKPPVEHVFLVVALDRKDGSVVWEQLANTLTPHQGTHGDGSFASSTPVTDGERIYASFGSFGLFAYTLDGEPVWQKDLGDLDIAMSFGEGSSPIVYGDLLIHNWDHNGDSFIVALDKVTGEERWRQARESATTWSTPIVVEVEGGPQVIVGAGRTIAYDLATGKELWAYGQEQSFGGPPGGREGGRSRDRDRDGDGGEHEGGDGDGAQQTALAGGLASFGAQGRGQGGPGQGGRRGGRGGGGGGAGVITSPVYHDGVLLFVSGGRRGAFRAIRVAQAKGDVAEDSEALLWSSEGDTPHVPSPIAYDGIFYSLKSDSGLLSAFDVQSGERLYGPERLSGLANAYASPVAADGHLYFAGRDGTIEVVAAGPEFKSLVVNTLDDEFDASPAIVGNELFLRGRSHVYCIAEE